MRKIFCTIITLLMIISCIPLQLFADSASYDSFSNGDSFIAFSSYSSSNNNYGHICYLITSGSNEIRVIALKQANENKKIGVYLVSTSSFSARQASFSDPVRQTRITTMPGGGVNNNAGSYSYNGTTYYLIRGTFSSSSGYNSLEINIPSYGIETDPTSNNATNKDLAVYYTFGDGAVDPVPPVNHGSLQDLGYYTNFTNSQQMGVSSMRNNLDTITWNGYQDSNGNQINTIDYEVEIQAGITDYSGTTESDLLNQTLQDIDVRGYTTIYTGSANRGEAKFTWQEVATALWSTDVSAFDFWNRFITNYIDGFYYVYGWMYRIRLKKADDSWVGEWQTIYQVTSAPPADSQQIMNYYYTYYNTGVDPATYQAIQNINTINNVTNNYYYENQTIPSDDGDDISDGNWFQLIYQLLFGNDNETLVNQGNNVNQTVNNALDQEDDYLSDLQDQLNDLEPNDITENNGLINSLNWIRQVHNLTIETTLYRDIVITILFVGLIVYLIGRRQG